MKQESQKPIHTFVDLFGGEKGGVGKTFVAKTAIQYNIDRDNDFVAVETDRSNPDVGSVYRKWCKFAYFTEDAKHASKADKVFELALQKNVIVNLPSQVQTPLKTWFETNSLFDLGEEYNVEFRKWFVTNGEYDSVKLFLKSLEIYGDKMPHFLVKNWGVCDEWGQIDLDSEIQEAIEKYQVKVVEFPKLGYAERYFLNKHRLNFAQAREHKDLAILGRKRVLNFLDAAYDAFDSTNAWDKAQKVGAICESA